jgi:hypothetical protein
VRVTIAPNLKDWLLSIIGHKLKAVLALIYVYDGKEDLITPQELMLQFETNMKGKFSCSSDGESLAWDNHAFEPSELGEYGDEIVKVLSHLPYWKHLIGKRLNEVKMIIPSHYSCLIGLQFLFEDNLSVVVINLGDELFIFNSLPENFIQDEELILVPVDKWTNWDKVN